MDLNAPKILDFAINILVVLFAVSFHESAHALSALAFGDTTARDMGRISLNPLRHIDLFGSIILPIVLYLFSGMVFGYAKPTPVDLRNTRNPRLADLVVSAAGPVSNFLLVVLGTAALYVLSRVDPGSAMHANVVAPLLYVVLIFLRVNLVLAIFNLIPIPPLDGSGVLAGILGGGTRQFFNRIAPFGFLILIVLMSTSLFGRILGPVFGMYDALLQRLLR